MTVQPSGTAVLGTYAAVASAVMRLPKRLALAAIIPIIAIVDIGILVAANERFLVFAWTNIAYIFMFVIGHLAAARARTTRSRRRNCSKRRSGRGWRATRRRRSTSAGGSRGSFTTSSPTRSRRSRWSSRGRACWPSTATSTPT